MSKDEKQEIFISYSHMDKKKKEKFVNHLEPINIIYETKVWHDGVIDAGGNITKEILEHLNKCSIVLLLISVNFINSSFCMSVELQNAIQRHKKGECVVIPVILSEVSGINKMPFKDLKRVPEDGKPITSFKPQDKGYKNAVDLISDILEKKEKQVNDIRNKVSIPVQEKNIKRVAKRIKIPIFKNGITDYELLEQNTVDNIPNYVDRICKFVSSLSSYIVTATHRFENDFKNSKTSSEKEKLRLAKFRAFLITICGSTKTYIFGDNNTRVHFRCLKDDSSYVSIVTIVKANEIKSKLFKILTEIPVNLGMIHRSSICNAPLIKSLNQNFHYNGTHDDVWSEYITLVFKNISSSNVYLPILSMAVSFTSDSAKKNMDILKFLAYTRIDIIIENLVTTFCDEFKKIDSDYSLKKVIESYIPIYNKKCIANKKNEESKAYESKKQ